MSRQHCYAHNISRDLIEKADKDTQLDVMRTWFSERYQDPVEECPYDSEEGGYIYVWGGPYIAAEELHGEFSGIVPDDVIDELAAELDEITLEWAGRYDDEPDEYFVDAVGAAADPLAGLVAKLGQLAELRDAPVADHLQQTSLQMLFVSAITALEAFLCEFFIKVVTGEPEHLRNFVERNKEFMERKFSLSEVFTRHESIEETVRDYLADLIWHNLVKVKSLFHATLKVEFPDLGPLLADIRKRHDIVHRSGRTKDGATVTVSASDVTGVLDRVDTFAKDIVARKPQPAF